MQTFLTKTAYKKVVLLEYLLEKNDWCTLKELTSFLDVTEKSIFHYIEELTELFAADGNNILLENQENKRFMIKKEKDFPIYTIYLHFYRASYNYQLIDFMYKYPEKVLKDFAQAQYTSISTVFRYGKLLKPFFQRYHMTFHSFQLSLAAPEARIRAFYYYFYWHSARESRSVWPFLVPERRVEELIHRFVEIYEISLNFFQRRVFAFWLAIIIDRSQYQTPQLAASDQQVILSDPYFALLTHWRRTTDIDLNQRELCFLYRVIYAFGVMEGQAKYENSYRLAHQRFETCSYRLVLNLAETIQQEFDFSLDLTDPELLFNLIAFHERSALFWGNPDLFFNRSPFQQVQEVNPQAAFLLERLRKRLVENATKDVAKQLTNWEQLGLDYYYILDYYQLFLQKQTPIKILIQDDLHHTHRLWLRNKINRYFDHSYKFIFYDSTENLEDVDLVISNYYIETAGRPLLLMKNIPTERNWRLFEKIIYQLKKAKSTDHG